MQMKYYDNYYVYDGEDESSGELLVKHYGSRDIKNIVSTKNTVFVKIVAESDRFGRNISVKLRYRAVKLGCNGIYTGNRGEISLLRTPDEQTVPIGCHWNITVPNGKSIRLLIETLEVKYPDRFRIYDGNSESDRQLYHTKFGYGMQAYGDGVNVISSSNKMLVTFHSDVKLYLPFRMNTIYNITIRLHWEAIDHGCGLQLNNTQGVIYSPGYPGNYFNNIQCDWKITVPIDHIIVLTFDDFCTEDNDQLTIDTYTPLRHSGPHKPSNLLSSTNSLSLKFKTDQSLTDRGFKITYKAKSLDPNITFLISAYNAILKVHSSRIETQSIGGQQVSGFVDYDLRRELIVWYDPQHQRFCIQSTVFTEIYVQPGRRPVSLALDWQHGLLYWLDIQPKSINVVSLDDNTKHQYTVCLLRSDNPRDLVVNAKRSVLVWSNVGSRDPNLVQSQMDGNNQTIFYRNSRHAFHLTIDYQFDRYFFVDIEDHCLYSIDFDGNDEQLYLKSRELLDPILAMSVIDNDLYFMNEYLLYRIPDVNLSINRAQVAYKIHRYPTIDSQEYFMANTVDIDRREFNGFKIIDIRLQPDVDEGSVNRYRSAAANCQGIYLPSSGKSYRCLSATTVPSYSLPVNVVINSDETIAATLSTNDRSNGFDYYSSKTANNGHNTGSRLAIVSIVFNALLAFSLVFAFVLILKLKTMVQTSRAMMDNNNYNHRSVAITEPRVSVRNIAYCNTTGSGSSNSNINSSIDPYLSSSQQNLLDMEISTKF
ncbi:uncharacterized protein LOC128954705 [Oppia nitens]|uniref:uncharacterized protein LOC128954705 n=1 Tax=Oppia nitens TaxID=1686743 RepID=UPI0023DA88FA|nr:uncharacterized protein LOC128954705 [Oppia nitens]